MLGYTNIVQFVVETISTQNAYCVIIIIIIIILIHIYFT